jgi:hypothetical protein
MKKEAQIVSYNMGYISPLGSSGILTWYPEVLEMSLADFCKLLRDKESIETIWERAIDSHITPSSACIMFRYDEGAFYWEWTVKMINVREYREYWELKRNKKWKES